jgi:hypothetical protein
LPKDSTTTTTGRIGNNYSPPRNQLRCRRSMQSGFGYVPHSLSLSSFLFLSLSLSLFRFCSLSLTLFRSVTISPFLSFFLSYSLSISLSLSLSLFLYLFFSPFLFLSLCLFLSLSLYFFIFLFFCSLMSSRLTERNRFEHNFTGRHSEETLLVAPFGSQEHRSTVASPRYHTNPLSHPRGDESRTHFRLS